MASPEPDISGRLTGQPSSAGDGLEQTFERGGLYTLRATVAAHASAQGASPVQVEHLVIIASELATNAIAHGGGCGSLRLWRDGDQLYCQVSDAGPGIPEPRTAGTQPPPPHLPGGRGVWIARQLCDRLDIAAGPDGTTITAMIDLANGAHSQGV
jgi:anti-sigma regulatory factor (Ser/Thr protein kinase)